MTNYSMQSSTSKAQKHQVIIIGGGAAGAFTGYFLKKQYNIESVILEAEPNVGGKCKTYIDSSGENTSLNTEYGAMIVARNYDNVLRLCRELGIKLTGVFDGTHADCSPIRFEGQNGNWWGKVKLFYRIVSESLKIFWYVYRVNYADANYMELDQEYSEPFSEFAKRHKMSVTPHLLKYFVTGFGYGALDELPTRSILKGIGYLTVPYIFFFEKFGNKKFLQMESGFQNFIGRVTENLDVRTKVKIENIVRDKDGVRVNYTSSQNSYLLEAKKLVLAIPPNKWRDLNIQDLTHLEQELIDNTISRPYPVAICKIKNLPAGIVFFENAIQGQDGFGKIAFMTTKDSRVKPKDGRLFTAYINLSPRDSYVWSKKIMHEKLVEAFKGQKLAQYVTAEDITILDVKIWDYMPLLDYKLIHAYGKQQGYNNSFATGATFDFETVECVAQHAKLTTKKISDCLSLYQKKKPEGFFLQFLNLYKNYRFFYDVAPICKSDKT